MTENDLQTLFSNLSGRELAQCQDEIVEILGGIETVLKNHVVASDLNSSQQQRLQHLLSDKDSAVRRRNGNERQQIQYDSYQNETVVVYFDKITMIF